MILVPATCAVLGVWAQAADAVQPSDTSRIAPALMRSTAMVGWETHDDWPARCGRIGQSAMARVVRADLGCVVVDRHNQTCTIITDRRSSTGALGVLFELCSRETR